MVGNANTISAVAAAVFAGWGLVYSGMQTAQAARSTDYDTLVHLDAALRDLENDYRAARGGEASVARRAHNQFYNKLEVLASGVRHKLFARQSRSYARALLTDLLAWDEYLGGLDHIGEGRQGRALEDVAWFTSKHRREIDQRKKEYRAKEPEREGAMR